MTLTFLGAMIAASSHLWAMWQVPEEVEELTKQVSTYVAQSTERTSKNEAVIEQQGKLLELLVKKSLNDNTRIERDVHRDEMALDNTSDSDTA